MPNLLVKPKSGNGLITDVTPQNAGWSYVGFQVHKVSTGEVVSAETGDREVCLVWLTGSSQTSADGEKFGSIGGRNSVFDGPPTALYVPANSSWSVTAERDLELAVCSAPGEGRSGGARLITSDKLSRETRGEGTNMRYVTNILPEDEPADSLLVVEVITPGGHSSSYPPHKHDDDNEPHETFLEETYYHRLNPSQGFAFQRVYTQDRSLDEAMAVEDGDVVMVPEGYHPCAACHGYDLYYLNVMAGPKRKWRFNNAPEHEWMLNNGKTAN